MTNKEPTGFLVTRKHLAPSDLQDIRQAWERCGADADRFIRSPLAKRLGLWFEDLQR